MDAKSGQLGPTLAAWLFALDDAGHRADDPDIRSACDALRAADAEEVGEHGARLVRIALSRVGGEDADFDAVADAVRALYGRERVATSFGDGRADRVAAARAYHFRTNLPWLARIFDRFPDGRVGPHWVMVERITDVVHCLDPYPWDDLDEQRDEPLVDFLVKWELDGARCLRLLP